MKIPYCTVAEANTINADNDAWLALEDSAKEASLVGARYYMDAHYSCVYVPTEGAEEFKYVNAWFAADATVGTGLYSTNVNEFNVKESFVESGSSEGKVVSKKVYFTPRSFSPATKAKADDYLAAYCDFIGGNINFLLRG